MRIFRGHPDILLKHAARVAMALIICWGFILVLAQIMPFWVDEWRLMYSLKFKTIPELFGPLYFTQQFPRVYLALLKLFAAPFDYSYFTLRLPAFLTGVGSIILCYRLMNRIYGPVLRIRYLFLLIILGSPVFMRYLVQIKQYEMEIFLSLLGIWQLLCLTEPGLHGLTNRRRYVYLCLSFLIAPFFSYTYPIVIAPVYLLLTIHTVRLLRRKEISISKAKTLALQWAPLLGGLAAIVAFYVIDVSQVMKDQSMHCFWQDKIMDASNPHPLTFLLSIWNFFGSAGSGLVYQVIFAALGFTAMGFAFIKSRSIFSEKDTVTGLVQQYAVILLSLCLLLFAAGKLPLGESRLNAFTFPAMAVLIIHLLRGLKTRKIGRRLYTALSCILYLGLFGSIATSVINSFTNSDYLKTVHIYNATEDAIIYAQARNLPIVITPDIAWPYDILHDSPCLSPIDAASVLKTFPAYKEKEQVPVFSINDTASLKLYGLPADTKAVVAGNGEQYKVISSAAYRTPNGSDL
jgi:hypothetical protein